MKYLPDFLNDNPHETACPIAGHPAHGGAVELIKNEKNVPVAVGANYFMAYHSILKTSEDFTNALKEVYTLTDEMNQYLRENSNSTAEVFPYR